MTQYVAFFDRSGASENKIHKADCVWYQRHLSRRKLGINTMTTRWDEGPFWTRQAAETKTGVKRACEDCLP